jgi:hypothetical protein
MCNMFLLTQGLTPHHSLFGYMKFVRFWTQNQNQNHKRTNDPKKKN